MEELNKIRNVIGEDNVESLKNMSLNSRIQWLRDFISQLSKRSDLSSIQKCLFNLMSEERRGNPLEFAENVILPSEYDVML